MKPTRYTWPAMPTLWKRNNGRYYVLWQEAGKGRQKSLGTTEGRIATRLFNAFRRDLLAGKVKSISTGLNKTFTSFVDEFLQHILQTKEISTYKLYSVALDKAKACWGDMPLQHITARHIDRFITDMTRVGLRTPTINKNYRHLKAALSKAYEWEYLKVPVRFPKPLREERQVRFLSAKELRALINTIEDMEFADFCLLSAYTGLRSGEILRLRWPDIDNPKDFLRISAKRKNKQELRLPINKHARAILNRCKARKGKKPFRFNTRTWISQKFKGYARQAGLGQYRFHDLRHTFASHLAMKGEDLKAIQELLGHSSIASTMVYAQVSPEYLKKVSEKLNYGPMPVGKE
ncbi:MAG: site-specific integrase [Deltaproteobacteria bacterium]|nr:site-specific integrase [Deltaproteobacteria bacterium]